MVTIEQLDFDHLYIPRTTQGQPWPLALGSGFLISPTDPGPAGPRDLASPTDPGPAGPGLALTAPLFIGPLVFDSAVHCKLAIFCEEKKRVLT